MSLRLAGGGSPVPVMVLLATALSAAWFVPQVCGGTDDADADENTARLRQMRELAESIVMYRIVDGERVPAGIVPEPVLRWNDAARRHLDGTVWLWGRSGRPVAVMELYPHMIGRPVWMHVGHSLALDPVTADGIGGRTWTPARPAFTPRRFRDAPPPAGSPAARLRQMRELARRFDAHQFWDPDNQRYELRLLTQPVHRYDDNEAGLLDGALFLFVHATNPEVVLLVEAVRDGSGTAWQYGLVRLGHAEMHVALDGREVWQQPRVTGLAADDSYWLFFRPAVEE